MTSIIYTPEGKYISCSGKYDGHLFFEKQSDPDNEPSDNEVEICQILQRNPHPNICTIYKIDYIDSIIMELLNTQYHITNEIIEQMRCVKDYLQSLGIVYLDWKPDNIGLDANGIPKLFDFNCSAFYMDNEWSDLVPSSYVQRHSPFRTPIEMDNWAFEHFLANTVFN